MGKLKRKRTDLGLKRIFNVDNTSAKELVEVAQKLRDAKPHTKVYIMTEDEILQSAHLTLDKSIERIHDHTRDNYNNHMRKYYACMCLFLSRHLHWKAKGIVKALDEIEVIARSFDNYEYIQDILEDVQEETGVLLEIGEE